MIAIITPTGARLNQFKLCAKFMKRQTYKDEVLWIIVDDALPVTTNIVQNDFRNKWKIVKIYPQPRWMGINTQARNIKVGIDYLKENYSKNDIKCIFIIEDDDYYKAVYLEGMMARLKNYWLIGETNTIYYNVLWRRFVINANRSHASLFQTAFTWDMIQTFEQCYSHKFIDARLWTIGKNKLLFYDNVLSVGMKGMPGRAGIGAGHSPGMAMANDIEMRFLNKIIGTDAKLYEGYYGDRSKPQYPLFIKRSL